MTTQHVDSSSVSRRTTLAAVAGGALGLALAGRAAARDATPAAMADHPLVGSWIVDRNPDDPAEIPTHNVLTADGGLIDPTAGGAGRWEATGPDTANFCLTGILTELGAYFVVRGTLAVDAGGRHRARLILLHDRRGRRHGAGRAHGGRGHGPLRALRDRTAGGGRATAGRLPGVDTGTTRHPGTVATDMDSPVITVAVVQRCRCAHGEEREQ